MLQGFPEAAPPSVEVLNLAERERGNPWRRVPLEHTESHPLNNAETILASNRWSTDAEIVRSGILTQQDGCWFWTGMLTGHGYGRVTRSVDGRTVGAPVHQLVWLESRVLRWPQGMVARHLCRNRDCCAADHITPGTHLENVHDAQFRDRTMPISIHRLPEELQERVRAGEAVELEWRYPRAGCSSKHRLSTVCVQVQSERRPIPWNSSRTGLPIGVARPPSILSWPTRSWSDFPHLNLIRDWGVVVDCLRPHRWGPFLEHVRHRFRTALQRRGMKYYQQSVTQGSWSIRRIQRPMCRR